MSKILFLMTFCLSCVVCRWEKCPNGDEIYHLGLNKDEQNKALKYHNDFRLMIARGKVSGQPAGINLRRMSYNKKLGKLARQVNLICKFEHFQVNDNRWRRVGQNLYKVYSSKNSTKPDWERAVHAWFKEHKDYKYPIGSINNKIVNHYTQVVWADSHLLGCDYMHFYNNSNIRKPFTKMYTCHYGPSGNKRGKAPYKIGRRGCTNLC